MFLFVLLGPPKVPKGAVWVDLCTCRLFKNLQTTASGWCWLFIFYS